MREALERAMGRGATSTSRARRTERRCDGCTPTRVPRDEDASTTTRRSEWEKASANVRERVRGEIARGIVVEKPMGACETARVRAVVDAARAAARKAKAKRSARGNEGERRVIDDIVVELSHTFQNIVESLLESRSMRSRHGRARADGVRRVARAGLGIDRDRSVALTDEILGVGEEYNASESALKASNDGQTVNEGPLVRLLDDFELIREETTPTGELVRHQVKFREELFEDAESASTLRVRGHMRVVSDERLRPAREEEGERVEVELKGIVGYQYAFTAPIDLRGFYVVTTFAAYKLMNPKSTYATLYERGFQMRFDLARRAARALPRTSRVTFDTLLPELETRQPPDVSAVSPARRADDRDEEGETWMKYKESDVLSCATTLCKLCANELGHLNRRSANVLATLVKKASTTIDPRRDARDEFVMCYEANVDDVRKEDLERIYGTHGSKTCADAQFPSAIRARRDDALVEWIGVANERFQAEPTFIEEALGAWQFCMEHANVLCLPIFAFDKFVRSLTCPPSKMSWALLRDIHCALTAQIKPELSFVMDSIMIQRAGDFAHRSESVIRVSKYDSELHVHAWAEIVREIIDDELDTSVDVKLAAFRASALLRMADYFQLTHRLRLATISALIALTLKQPAFREYIAEKRGELKGHAEPSVDKQDVVSIIKCLDTQCDELTDGYAHLTEEVAQEHPSVVHARSEIHHFLQKSSSHWQRLDRLSSHIDALMKQCQTCTFAQLRLILWNFEVTVFALQFLDSKSWRTHRENWRANLCATRTPAQLVTSAYILLSNLPIL